MLRLLLFMFISAWWILPAYGQDKEKVACYSVPRTTESFKRKLWDGYEISLGPARNGSGGDGDDCTAAIYSSGGKVVFRTTGFGVIFDQDQTGKDIDGDGKPEVVFMTDQGGGAHCCWVYNVVSLAPRPHKLFDVGEGGRVDFAKDKDGKTIVWERISGTHALTSEARAPYAERVFRVLGGKLVDATPDFCSRIFSAGNEDYETWNLALTPEKIDKLHSAEKVLATSKEIDVEDTVSALLSRAQQRVLCHQYDEALADLNLWPQSSRTAMKGNFAESIKSYSPEFAARLLGNSESK